MPNSFNPNSARRIAKATRRSEQTAHSQVPLPKRPTITLPAKYALVTTAIGAAVRSTSTLGLGAGTLQQVKYSTTDVATYSTLGISVPLYTGGLDPIATGRLVMVKLIDGRYHVDVDYCGG